MTADRIIVFVHCEEKHIKEINELLCALHTEAKKLYLFHVLPITISPEQKEELTAVFDRQPAKVDH